VNTQTQDPAVDNDEIIVILDNTYCEVSVALHRTNIKKSMYGYYYLR